VEDKEVEMIKKKKLKEIINKQDSAKTKAKEFAQAIVDCKEYKNFMKCYEALEKNQTARSLLKQSQDKQKELQRIGFNANTFQELRELQKEINKNETIQNFQKAQDEIIDILRKTNDIISGKIGIQFAFLRGGGCCG